jgi:hypothetical protein
LGAVAVEANVGVEADGVEAVASAEALRMA